MPTEIWKPYQPTTSDPWDLRKVAHLHRRAGFSATWSELQRDVALGPDESITRLLNAPPVSSAEADTYAGLRRSLGVQPDSADRLQAYWLHRMLLGSDPLREKMTLFWHDHFATSNAKVRNDQLMARQNETLRALAMGAFGELLNAMLGDPALLFWLDGVDTLPDRKPNENLARELLELFTMGPGNYAESDIRQAARALTGWTYVDSRRSQYAAEVEFQTDRFDHGTKSFLGQTGAWNASDLVRIILEQPATSLFLAKKLYRYFVSDAQDPPRAAINELAHRLRQHDYDVGKIVELILRSSHFFADDCRRQKIASPVELSVGVVRQFDTTASDLRFPAITDACKRQGQYLFFPPNVAGWKGSRHWINSLSLLQRTNWLTDMVWGNANSGVEPFDPVAWLEQNNVPQSEAVSAFVELLLQGDASEEVISMATSVARPNDRIAYRRAIQILLHAPEYQFVLVGGGWRRRRGAHRGTRWGLAFARPQPPDSSHSTPATRLPATRFQSFDPSYPVASHPIPVTRPQLPGCQPPDSSHSTPATRLPATRFQSFAPKRATDSTNESPNPLVKS